MTFLSPSSLFLLFAITIPIAIHLLNRFNVKNVEFSTIRFLKSLENNAIKKIKFKKFILLLLRLGIITSLVLMLARPVTKGFMPGWISAELESRLLLVIDNSSSMSGKVNTQTLLDIVKKTAKDLSQIFSENTTVNIVQTCPPKILYSGKVTDSSIPLIIDQINQTVKYDNIWTLVDSLTKTIQATEPIKECIILSDFQNNDFPDNRLSDKWKFYLVNIGEINNNLSINNLEVVSRIKVPNQLLKLKTSIKNTGNVKITNSPINLFLKKIVLGR